jgi:cell wall-associated NlpC family hydrolase
MLDPMLSPQNAADRLRHRLRPGRKREPGQPDQARTGNRRVLPAVVSVVAVVGAVTGTVLATVGGRPAGADHPYAAPTSAVDQGLPGAQPDPGASVRPVVPLLGVTADGRGRSIGVPVAGASSQPRAGAGTGAARQVPVAPLRGLREADLLVVAPFPLSSKVLAAVSRQPEVTSAEPIEAARVKINGSYTAVLGVNASTFRGYAAGPTAASDPLWRGVANGGIAISYTMGKLDRLSLGGRVIVAGHQLERLPVVAFGTVGIGGVDAVVSDPVARSLGMPARNAIVVSAPPASVASVAARIKLVIPSGAAVEPLVTQVTRPAAAGLAPSALSGSTAPAMAAAGLAPSGGVMTTAQLVTALRAAESRRGLPYQWGAAGPAAFDCSGLVQWSFAQAGVAMPRVAADQARTGPAVPVSQLQPGDLLFYHTDPTAPGYISHVAIYLGSGLMIQAPQPGMAVEVVPASFDSQFAGAVRVYPQLAARVAAGLA